MLHARSTLVIADGQLLGKVAGQNAGVCRRMPAILWQAMEAWGSVVDWEWLLTGPLPVGPGLIGAGLLGGFALACVALRWLRADDGQRFAAERAALELALRQTGDARALLHQQVSSQGALLAAIPAGMAVFDADDALLSWNPDFAALADISADRMRVGAAFSDLLGGAERRLADTGQVEWRRAGLADGRSVILLVPLSLRMPARPKPVNGIVATPALAEPIVRDLGLDHRRARRMVVLLVEDIVVNQIVTATALRRDGHRVDVASSGAEALRMAARIPYELVLMDLMMPGMSGYEAARAIRATSGLAASVPIVALTATASDQDRTSCWAAGMQGMLTKPVPPAALADLLAECLQPLSRTSQPAAPARDTRLLDVVRLADLQRGLPEGLFTELVDEALGEMGARLSRLHAALQAGLMTEAMAESHALAGIAGSYGLVEFEHQMRRVMFAIRGTDMAAAVAAGDGMAANMDRSASALRAMLRP